MQHRAMTRMQRIIIEELAKAEAETEAENTAAAAAAGTGQVKFVQNLGFHPWSFLEESSNSEVADGW